MVFCDYIIDVVRQSTFWKTQKILFHKGISIMAVRNVTIKKKGPKGDTKTIHMKSYGHVAFDLMLIQPSMRWYELRKMVVKIVILKASFMA